MSKRAVLRASDADREQVAERLRLAAAEGRLSPDEFEERLGAALGARTYGELDAIIADLPAPARVAVRPSHELNRRRPAVRTTLAVALVIGLVFAAVSAALGDGHPGHHGFWDGTPVIWLVWIALGWRYFARRSRRA
jgi:hypothetical protein